MANKTIDRLIHIYDELHAAFTQNNARKATELLNEIERENNEELKSAREFSINYLLSLHGNIGQRINLMKHNLNNPGVCCGIIEEIKRILHNIVDQRDVRDKLIKEIIAPIMKSWGYNKVARAFIKNENGYVKKVNVFSSQFNMYYDTRFIFEISIKGKGKNIECYRAKELWFDLNQDTDLNSLIPAIRQNLLRDVKPYLDGFK